MASSIFNSNVCLHTQIQKMDEKMKHNMKTYANAIRHSKESSINIGDEVLVKQQKQSKLSSAYNPEPLKVISKNQNMITAKSVGNNHQIARNNSFFKPIRTKRKPSRFNEYIMV
ncbi:Uncharacterised protein at_DN0589 [Pycnogonum litorale]